MKSKVASSVEDISADNGVGTVIHIYKNGEAFEVEFLTLHGETVAIATLEASQVRPVQKREITHARVLRA